VLSVTVSIGVAEPSDVRATPRAVLKAADEALYRAKQAGRNRVSR
jgi:diguanylate cyclase (GGDEF)-like protein